MGNEGGSYIEKGGQTEDIEQSGLHWSILSLSLCHHEAFVPLIITTAALEDISGAR